MPMSSEALTSLLLRRMMVAFAMPVEVVVEKKYLRQRSGSIGRL